MMKCFQKIDIFSERVNLTLQNESKIKTNFGAFFTLVFFATGIFIFIQNGKELIIKENPFTFQNMIISKDYLPKEINNKNFELYFSVQDTNGNVVNITNKLDITVSLWTATSEMIGAPTNVDVKNLSYYLVDPNSSNSNYKISDENIPITGSWNINNICSLQIYVSLCNNNTNSSCEMRSDILDFMRINGWTFNFYYSDVNLQLSNFNSPLTTSLQNTFITISGIYKSSTFSLRDNQINTDSGIIFSVVDNLNYITVDSFTTDISALGVNDLVIYNSFFITTNKRFVTHRSYLTLQNLFAQIGGLLNILFTIFSFVNQIFTKIKKNVLIINSVFEEEREIELKKDDKNENDISKSNNYFTSKVNNNNILAKPKLENFDGSNTNPPLKPKKETLDPSLFIEEITKHKMKNIEISMNMKDIFIDLWWCKCNNLEKSRNLKHYQILTKIIDNYCDVINYIKKFEEIEKLKVILLNPDQLKVFNGLKSKLRDIEVNKTDNEHENKEVCQLIKSISLNPANKIDENIKKYLIL